MLPVELLALKKAEARVGNSAAHLEAPSAERMAQMKAAMKAAMLALMMVALMA